VKIVILTQYFYPETGAPQNRLLELSQMLAGNGWDVKVVTAMPNYPKGKIFEGYEGKFKSSERIGEIDVDRYWLYASNAPKTLPRIISMLTISASSLLSMPSVKKFKPDYIFTESPPLTLAVTGYLLSKASGAKFIMNVSDIWPLSAKELGSIQDGKLYRAIESVEKFLYRKAFLCTGQSEEIIEHLKKSGAARTYLFRNGVDVKRFERVVKKEKLKSGKLRIVYAGLLGVAQKVFEIVKEIDFESLGAELHIFGEGSERKSIEEFVRSNSNCGVYIHESVSREEIPEHLSSFDCALIPLVRNIYGAVPSKIYEAMSAALPILFSGSGEGAKIVREKTVGLVNEPGDFNGLSANISKMIRSPAILTEMSGNCITTAREEFDRNKIIPLFAAELKSHISSA
jgi:glycosyltransferase involved in cell wall biosynthesis